MELRPGTLLAHYEILGPLGAGGMGEVWRARDGKLKREVALKRLPPQFADQPDRLARFEQEAVVLASLSHPNIAAIHGLEHADSVRFLVLELVEGRTIEERLLDGPIPVREAIGIAAQIAGALEAAHEKGIIHRDLKPANIKLTADGRVKVLDFGIAKAYGEAAQAPGVTGAETLPRQKTEAGLIMGTAAYMSPEQAEGKPPDKRADVWSFGVVLYEMLTGRRLFDGKSNSHVLVNVMEQEPDWSLLPPLPAGVLAMLQRCLHKDRNERLRDIGDVRLQLQQSMSQPVRAVARSARGTGGTRRWLWPSIAIAAAAGAFAIGAALFQRPAPPNAPAALRFEIPRPDSLVTGTWIALSPDGRRLAFWASAPNERGRIWIRSLETQEARPLDATVDATVDATGTPFWSADSRYLHFSAGGELRRIDVAGGRVEVLADVPNFVAGGHSTADGRLRFVVPGAGLFEIREAGGTPAPIPLDEPLLATRVTAPAAVPGGNLLLCQCLGEGERGIYLAGPGAAPPRRILPDASVPRYAPSPDPDLGYILFLRGGPGVLNRGGTLMAQRIVPRRLELRGDPVAIAERVNDFSVSDTGVLAYGADTGGLPAGVPGVVQGQLTWFDRAGRVLSTVGDPQILRIARLSPDGRFVALEQVDPGTQNLDIYVFEFGRGANHRFTFAAQREMSPVWSGDGASILYTRFPGDGGSEWYRRSADLAGEEELLFRLPVLGTAHTLTPDGRWALYNDLTPPISIRAVDLTRVAPARESVPVVVSGFANFNARFSRDGRWFAYFSGESGADELYVRPFDAGAAPGAPLSSGGKFMVSHGGARAGSAAWRQDGRELYYLAADGTLMSVEVRTEPTFGLDGPPRPLFNVPPDVAFFDAAPDGERFLVPVPAGAGVTAPPYKVILNWTATLE